MTLLSKNLFNKNMILFNKKQFNVFLVSRQEKTYKKAYVMYWECRGLALEGLPHSDPRLGNGCKNREKGASYEIL